MFKKSEELSKRPRQSGAKDAREYYANLLSEIAALNPATDAGYRACDELIDLDNYASYTAAIAYLNDSDYMSNYTLWRLQEGASGPPEYRKCSRVSSLNRLAASKI